MNGAIFSLIMQCLKSRERIRVGDLKKWLKNQQQHLSRLDREELSNILESKDFLKIICSYLFVGYDQKNRTIFLGISQKELVEKISEFRAAKQRAEEAYSKFLSDHQLIFNTANKLKQVPKEIEKSLKSFQEACGHPKDLIKNDECTVCGYFFEDDNQ